MPIITVDQPLFKKKSIGTGQKSHGEDHLTVMFEGLHIEIAVFKTIGNLVYSSELIGALVQANVVAVSTAD